MNKFNKENQNFTSQNLSDELGFRPIWEFKIFLENFNFDILNSLSLKNTV